MAVTGHVLPYNDSHLTSENLQTMSFTKTKLESVKAEQMTDFRLGLKTYPKAVQSCLTTGPLQCCAL